MRQLRKITAILLVLAVAMSLAGCKKTITDKEYAELAEKQAEKNKKTVLLKITVDGQTTDITAYDLVYFLAYNEKSGYNDKSSKDANYRAIYGDEYNYWDLRDSSGTMMKDSYKNAAFSTIAYTYIFYNEAKKAGTQLEEVRRVKLDSATQNFLAGFSAEQRARCGMTEACIRDIYEKVFLADQYATQMTADFTVDEAAVKATIDKEDYRLYKTYYLYVAKYDYDEDFKRVEFSAEESAARREAMDDTLARCEAGEDMGEIQKTYSEFMTYGTRSIKRNDKTLEAEYVQASMELSKNKCKFIETSGGYYVIRLDDRTQFDGYDEAVQDAIEKAKSSGIADLYLSYENKYNIEKTSEWDKIELGKYAITK
ncbi:MAG: hypothetical protein J5643_11305 [Lachnospiraceae bacterium]|nr:hypothetical protein [Lachnospiraceae bacterium]